MNKEIQKDESPNLSLNNQRNIQKDSVINTSINNINYAITNNNNNSNILIQDDYNEFHSKIEEYSPKKSKINSKNNIEKIQQLIESKRILSTLRTIKSNNSVNYEDIKLLPTLFVDMQEALKKSNANVLELKETIKDKLDSEKNLKDKIKEMELENKKILEKLYQHKTKENEMKQKFDELKYENLNLNQNLEYNSSIQKKLENLVLENKNLKRLNTELNKKIENYEEEINFLNKSKQELELKNKKFKNAQGLLQTEICNIEEYLEDVKNFQIEIKKMQHELKTIKELNKKLEDDKKKALKENYNYINTIKDMKIDLKNLLNEKMELLKLEKESQNKTNILFKEIQEEKKKNEKLIKNLGEFDEIKIKYKEMLEEFNKISNENEELKEELQSKNIEDINKLKEKYETEVFELKSLINIWKNNFLEISKFKLINYSIKSHQEIESIIDIDENYIENAPSEIKDISKKVLEYFKLLIEQENYKTVDLKHLKESLISEQEKVNILSHKLKNEKFLRRKIHNRYMYLRGNLRVMCRVRPFLPSEKINKKSQIETMVINNDSISIFQENKQEKNFEYDYIFDTKSTQKDVYEEVTLLIQSMVQGNNICIIAYGQTCTGKTYTIQGPNSKNQGIVPRAARELFLILNNFNKSNFFESIRLSMTIIEIYNEQIYNLLEESTPNLNMYEDASGNLIIPDLNPISINSFDEANKLFKLAAKFRHTSSTEYNDRSSRSHCIFSFQLKLTGKDGRIIRSTLHIIDLAGSERISKSQNKDEKLRKESICINLSLHSLSTVLNSIALKANHIPYRDSKLTHFLKDSLNENYNILLILLVSPNVKDISETISTLQFGERIVKICHHKTGKDKIQFLNSK
jgi:kinesin family protein C2/C3